MLRDELSKICDAVDSALNKWKETARQMGLDNQPINPNDVFFDSIKSDLKARIRESCIIDRS